MHRACFGSSSYGMTRRLYRLRVSGQLADISAHQATDKSNGNRFASLVYHFYMALQALGPVGHPGG